MHKKVPLSQADKVAGSKQSYLRSVFTEFPSLNGGPSLEKGDDDKNSHIISIS